MTSVLMNRGFHALEDVTQFLDVSLEQLEDPFSLPNMTIAVARIQKALDTGESICIYGDYDVDGMTSVAILYRTFKALGGKVFHYIPGRMEEGYGLNVSAMDAIFELGASLVITVDCGITAVEPALRAKTLGLDLIITDHHECQPELPEAVALINPKLPNCSYPFDMLAGAGIALKLAMALLGDHFYALAQPLLALSAIGTIADIAPLVAENRIIAKYGLEALTEIASGDAFPGIQALLEVCQLMDKEIGAGNVGFMIGPRLNAVGRLEHAEAGVELLISEDLEAARQIAARLDALNRERQETERKILEEAITLIERDRIHRSSGTLVVWGKDWHPGVVGIVASRLVERYYRPVIVLSDQGDVYKGSARSVEGYSIFEALLAQKKWLLKFGGHEQAAGLTLEKGALPALLEGLGQYNRVHLTDEQLTQKLRCEASVASREVRLQLLEELSHLEPYGVGNPRPIFKMSHLRVDDARRMGKQQEHIKLTLNDHYKMFEAVYFRYGERPLPEKGQRVDIAVQLDVNTWQGVESVQLLLKDFRSYSPGANGFNQRLHGYYLKALLLRLLAGSMRFDLSEARKPEARTEEETALWLGCGERLAVWSFEGLLELAYTAHDLGEDVWSVLDRVDILPVTVAPGAISIDLPLDKSAGEQMAQVGYKRLDHVYSQKVAKRIVFERAHGADLFGRLRRDGKLDLTTLLMSSESPYEDLTAVGFFIEAGFAQLEGDWLTLVSGPHQKMRYEDSRFAAHVASYQESVAQLESYMRSYREL